MQEESGTLASIRFGRFELSAETGELRKDGVRLRLTGQAIQVLVMLAANPGKLVTREELQQKLWPGASFGDPEHGLNAAVNKLREALGDSATEPKYVETVPGRGYRFIAALEPQLVPPEPEPPAPADPPPKPPWWKRKATIGLIVVVAVVWFLWRLPRVFSRTENQAASSVGGSPGAIAVLPFQNSSSDRNIDFLELALADEVATTLSHVQSFSIRPAYTTIKYRLPGADLQIAAREMRVTSIVTGELASKGDQVEVVLEATDVATNHIVWQDSIIAPAKDMLGLREKITSRLQRGLIPALGGTFAPEEVGTRPTNEEAYDLYLRSIATAHDPVPNREAISMLQRSVSLDPSYAPAWEALGLRYYYDGAYGGGGDQTLKLSKSTFEHALLLDPNLVSIAAELITDHAERGELADASAEAVALVKRRPKSAEARFALAYVLRYAGLLEESAQECRAALALDRGNYEFRSCATTFMQLNQPQMAMEFVRLNAASEYAARASAYIQLGEGKPAEALKSIHRITPASRQRENVDLFEACLDPARRSLLESYSRQAEMAALAVTDPEARYMVGRLLAYCGQNQPALRLLNSAIAQNYCALNALKSDPLVASLRGTIEYDQLMSLATQCHDKFVNMLKQAPN